MDQREPLELQEPQELLETLEQLAPRVALVQWGRLVLPALVEEQAQLESQALQGQVELLVHLER